MWVVRYNENDENFFFNLASIFGMKSFLNLELFFLEIITEYLFFKVKYLRQILKDI